MLGNPIAGYDSPLRWEGKSELGRSFPDGTSHTVLFAEKFGLCGGYPNGGSPYPYNGNGSVHGWNVFNWAWCPIFAYADLHDQKHDSTDGGKTGWDQLFQTDAYPIETCDPTKATSAHPGVMNVALADGSVRVLTEGIDFLVWRGLLTPNGGEIAY